MMARSSLRPVRFAIEAERRTSLSRFTPSGVNSKTQAEISAGRKPTTRRNNA